MKEALLYEKLTNNQVKCRLCHHFCLIKPESRGICGVRENQDGTLFSLVYGKAISVGVDPMEKKPFFHFLPGSFAYSLATQGCNFRCDNCQNWQISQCSKGGAVIAGNDRPPEKIVQDALKNNCASMAYTYTEPTIFFEYALETMKLAKKQGLKNVFVSNGYMTEECLKIAGGYLAGINVDLKFFDDRTYLKNCGSHLQPILDNLVTIKKMGIWLEITTLAIPTLSDQPSMFEEMAEFIYDKLGADTPWHISRFSGTISFKLEGLPDTPVETLIKAREIGLKKGLHYVYMGNVPGEGENTLCPKCKTVVIERIGYEVKRYDQDGKCPQCHYQLAGVFK